MTGPESRRPLSLALRTFFAALLVPVAIVCALLGVFLPFDLASQARTDRLYYAQFQYAAAQFERTGHLPLRAPSGVPEANVIYPLAIGGADCGPPFEKPASERFVLSFWRGEWTECYSFPSGRTTLPMSVLAYMRGSVGQLFIGLWLIALGAIWGAIRLIRRRAAIPAASAP